MKVRKGDNVMVIAGKDRGKTGKILRAFPNREQVIIEGVNIKKKHQRPNRRNQKGQILSIASPIHVSNVQLIDPKSDKPTRVGLRVEKDKKIRFAKRSGAVLD